MISSFSGEHRWLSNFSEHSVMLNPTIVFPTVEHGFVWHKTTNSEMRQRILMETTPGRVKRLGRKIELRPEWESLKLTVMHELVLLKFQQHEGIRQLLIETGEQELVEGNKWGDTFWGVCEGEGENNLGRILMKIRSELRK